MTVWDNWLTLREVSYYRIIWILNCPDSVDEIQINSFSYLRTKNWNVININLNLNHPKSLAMIFDFDHDCACILSSSDRQFLKSFVILQSVCCCQLSRFTPARYFEECVPIDETGRRGRRTENVKRGRKERDKIIYENDSDNFRCRDDIY